MLHPVLLENGIIMGPVLIASLGTINQPIRFMVFLVQHVQMENMQCTVGKGRVNPVGLDTTTLELPNKGAGCVVPAHTNHRKKKAHVARVGQGNSVSLHHQHVRTAQVVHTL
jgi:hypothetical protein